MEAVEARPTRARRGKAELSAEQKPSEELQPVVATVTEVLEPEPAAVVIQHQGFPNLVPEWVPKLQLVASGAAILFAAVAIVVERHEQRYHSHPIDELN
jgi:hypothetical protein